MCGLALFAALGLGGAGCNLFANTGDEPSFDAGIGDTSPDGSQSFGVVETLRGSDFSLVPTADGIDILLVLDNSGSMFEEQTEFAARLDLLVDGIVEAGTDFHIAVATTDVREISQTGRIQVAPGLSVHESPPCERPVSGLDCDTLPDPVMSRDDYTNGNGELDSVALMADLACVSNVGTCGNGFEAGLEAMQRALSDPLLTSANDGFLRDDAALAVVFLTDEDDCSTGGAFEPDLDIDCYVSTNQARLTPVDTFYDFLVGLKVNRPGHVYVAGIIGPDDFAQRPAPGEDLAVACTSQLMGELGHGSARSSARYSDLINRFGGTGSQSSICANSYIDAMTEIGEDLATLGTAGGEATCLEGVPLTCNGNADCGPAGTCLTFTAVGETLSVCDWFEVGISVEVEGTSAPYVGPGTAAEMSTCTNNVCSMNPPAGELQFTVDLGDASCPSLVSYTFTDGNVPASDDAFVYVSYPVE